MLDSTEQSDIENTTIASSHGFHRKNQAIHLTLYQKLVLKLFRAVYIGHKTKPRWRGELPFYAFTCPIHGLVEDYPHGHDKRLECPSCREALKI
jgi:hypothetical protein